MLPTLSIRRSLASIIALSLCFPLLTLTFAAETVSIEVAPAKLELAAGETAEAILLIHNPTASKLTDLRVKWFTNSKVTLVTESLEKAEVPANGNLACSLHVTRSDAQHRVGSIHLQLTYRQVGEAMTSSPPNVATAVLETQERPSDTVEKTAELKVHSATGALSEQRPGYIVLEAHNLSSVPIKVTKIDSVKPDFVQLELPSPGIVTTIPPHGSFLFGVPVTIGNSVRAGPQLVLFQLEVEWLKSGSKGTGKLTLAHTVNVEVLGESDLLKLLGVPSFLFLPGFLMLTTYRFLRSRMTPGASAPAELSVPEFALISISLSLLTAIAYPWLTDFFGHPRNYLEGYGLTDVFQVWFGSVILAVVFWAVVTGGRELRNRYQAHVERERQTQLQAEIARRTPNDTDTPFDILEKMQLNNVRFPLEELVIEAGGSRAQCFIILPSDAARPFQWVAPTVVLTAKSELANPGDESAWMQRIDEAPDAEVMMEILQQSSGNWEIRWGKEGFVTGPTRVDRLDFTVKKSSRSFVEFG